MSREDELLQLLRGFYQRFNEATGETESSVKATVGRIPTFSSFSEASRLGAESERRDVWPHEEGLEALRLPELFFIRRSPHEEGWTLLPNQNLKVNPSGKSSRRCWLFDPAQQESDSERQNRYRNRAGRVAFFPVNFNIQPTAKTQSKPKQHLRIDGLKMVRFTQDDEPYLCEDDRMCLICVCDSKPSLATRVKACSDIEYRKLVNPPLDPSAGVLPCHPPTAAQQVALDDPVDERGRSQLYLLCETRDRDDWAMSLQQAKELIARKADVSRRTVNGSTPLIAAAHKGNFDLVSFLLESRASPNSKSQGGHAAVHHASWKGDRRVFELLYHHPEALRVTNQPLTAGPVLDICRERCTADCHVGPEVCWNVLIWEYQQKHALAQMLIASLHAGNVADIRQRLTSENVDWPVDQRTGSTGLHVAAEAGQEEVGRLLLLELRASTDAQRLDGCTALHMAALHGHTALVQLLLDAGADANVHSLTRECAVHLASYHGSEQAFELLYAKTAQHRRRPLHSMHTACVDDGASGPQCTCRECERWKAGVWAAQFGGRACREAAGTHVCKHRLLFQRERREAQANLTLLAEVERLRAQLAAVGVGAEQASALPEAALRNLKRARAAGDTAAPASLSLSSAAVEQRHDAQELWGIGGEGSEMSGDVGWNLLGWGEGDGEGEDLWHHDQSQGQELFRLEAGCESAVGEALFQLHDVEFPDL